MKLVFNIEYYTEFGQDLYITGNIPELGTWDKSQAAGMKYTENGKWILEIFIENPELEKIDYKYFVRDRRNNTFVYEWGGNREFSFKGRNLFTYLFFDYWRPMINLENPLYTSSFTGNLWRRKVKKSVKPPQPANHIFQLYAPRIDNDHVFCICGDDKGLGNWNRDQAILMNDGGYPLWTTEVLIQNDSKPVQYKYGIYNLKNKKFVGYEAGPNRILDHPLTVIDNGVVISTDINYNYPQGHWKGAGVAIPVFSLRTAHSFGIGEFMDLKILVDWALKTGLKLVQILPVNDTIANHNWKDSYPYAAISVFALHPVYLNLPEMGNLKDKKKMDQFVKDGGKLNNSDTLDYVAVMKLKSRYYKLLYDQDKKKFLNDKRFKKFFRENKDWLVPYAAFSRLRDKYKTPVFTNWNAHAIYKKKEIERLVKTSNTDYDDYAIHYFIQFHLHLQLSEVTEYARSKGVILKGDLPIGIHRDSVDAWVAPGLYHMEKQAGAPPDAYSVTGQNWRFPTYNWEEMARDNYDWWQRRLSQMAKYFDAYRIDHILGFFRIWEIPYESTEGLMGIFNPSIPVSLHEFENRGVYFDYNRFCKPLIMEYMLEELFGSEKEDVKQKFLDVTGDGLYQLKESYNTQRKVEMFFMRNTSENTGKANTLRDGLLTLIGNILLFEEPGSDRKAFHPKIAFHSTYSYRELGDFTKNVLNDIYTDYFYHRQEAFWREQAMVKLPVIIKASNMMVCGEDLGMVPDCVPGVMYELGILRLYIQRMTKDTNAEFGHPAGAPYLSVASPSCHDMSTVRGWWEEDYERSQRFYNQILGFDGKAPESCDTWISEEILQQHLYSNAMWTIFPLQDLTGMDEKLMRDNPEEERINDPSNPDNLWQYRFHMNLEDLIKEKDFNKKLSKMVKNASRSNGF